MTNKRSTTRALILSVLSLLMCVSMLVGSTFAWFTDSVTSTNNIIKSGTLRVGMYWADGTKAVPASDSADWKNAANGPMFSSELWEPGYTEVKHIKIKNEGNLALKYQLNIEADGAISELADVIDVYFVDPATQVADRTALVDGIKVGTLTEVLKGMPKSTSGVIFPAGWTDTTDKPIGEVSITLALKMQETAGNHYQDMSIGSSFAVKLLATQFTAENDSFDDQYDVNAEYDGWVGGVDTSWYDASKTEFTIMSADDLAGLAEIVNSKTDNFDGDVIKLGANINLSNRAWTPIGVSGANFNGTIDGNGYTIYNLNARGTEGVGLIGIAGNHASIHNISIENATVNGNHYVGAVLGYGYLSANSLRGCTVKNAVVVSAPVLKNGAYDDGDKVGAVAGWASNGPIVNNKAIDCIVIGYRDIGGIIGYVGAENRSVEVSGNTIEDVQLSYYAVDNYAGQKANENMYSIVGRTGTRNGNTVTVQADNVSLADQNGGFNLVFDAASLKKALSNAGAAGAGDSTIVFTAEKIDMTGVAWTPIKVDGYHGADIVTIEGNNTTITGLTAPLFAGGFAGGSGIVINNLTIANSNIVSTNTIGSGAFIESVDSMQTITLNNCHLLNSTVVGGSGSRTGGLIGWTAGYSNVNDGPVKTYVTITNCSVIGNTISCDGSVGGIYGHAGNNDWTYSTIENCTVKDNKLNSTDDGGWRVGVVVGTANVGEVTISNITESGNILTQTGKTAPVGQSNLYGRFVPGTTGKLVINGAAVVLNGTQFANALTSTGNNVNVNLAGGNYVMPDGSEGNMQGKTITISGTRDTVIDVSNVDARDQFITGANLVFDGVTLNFGVENYMGFANTASLTYKNCKITGLQFLYGDSVTFENCEIDSSANTKEPHAIWTYGAKNVSFTNCNFTYGNRGINCYSDNDIAGGKQTVNFKNCTFTTTDTNSEGAVEINSCYFSVGIEVNLEGCTAPTNGEMAYVSQWDSTNGAKTTINIK